MPQILHTKDLGSVSLYGDALTGGYSGTKAQLYSLVIGEDDLILEINPAENPGERKLFILDIINKEVAAIPQAESAALSYNGEEQSPVFDGYDPNKMSMSGDISGTEVGEYTTRFSLLNGYKWDDGTTWAKEIAWKIMQIPQWSTGTDEEIAVALAEHHAGRLNLYDYWSVGDERVIHLSAIEADSSNGMEAQPEQDITMVLLNKGGKELSDGTECAFVVGMKERLSRSGKMSNSNSASSVRWGYCERRSWCNGKFKNALSESTLALFKEHKNKYVYGGSSTTVYETVDYFTLPGVYEVVGTSDYAGEGMQFEYYQTAENRQKGGSYWTRSKNIGNYNLWQYVAASGTNATQSATSSTNFVSVQGAI